MSFLRRSLFSLNFPRRESLLPLRLVTAGNSEGRDTIPVHRGKSMANVDDSEKDLVRFMLRSGYRYRAMALGMEFPIEDSKRGDFGMRLDGIFVCLSDYYGFYTWRV